MSAWKSRGCHTSMSQVQLAERLSMYSQQMHTDTYTVYIPIYRCILIHTDHRHAELSCKHRQRHQPHRVPSLADQRESLSVQNIHVGMRYGSPVAGLRHSACPWIPASPMLLAPGHRRLCGRSPTSGGYRVHTPCTHHHTHTHSGPR